MATRRDRYLDRPVSQSTTSNSGATYQVEIQVFWGNEPGGDVRVMFSAGDSGLRAFVPLSRDSIVAQAGHFVGE